uniref:Uncharacterized protein n=1 Tax=Anguilla anguilla TaxID=7936 RepID=A0A0E9TCA7_ANGAN
MGLQYICICYHWGIHWDYQLYCELSGQACFCRG